MGSEGQAGDDVHGVNPQSVQFVEDVGLYFESIGLPRMAGRVLGWLLICDPPQQATVQLAKALCASNGSISTTARMLIQMGFVERVAVRSDRRTFYQLRPHAWGATLEERVAEMKRLRVLAEQGLIAVEGTPEQHRERLTEMRELFAFLEKEFPALVDRYHDQQKEQPEAHSG